MSLRTALSARLADNARDDAEPAQTGPDPRLASPTGGAGADRHSERERLERAAANCGRFEWVGRLGTAPLRHRWLDVTHVGRENVPDEGPVILASNHLAFIDSVLLMYCLDRPVTMLGKSEYLDHPLSRRVFPAAGMLPLDRSGRHARVSLEHAIAVLERGGAVGVHPEGTRSRDGLLSDGHRGVAQIALRANAPVVPVGLIGTGVAQPIGQIVPLRRAPVEVRFGAPIGLGRWAANRRSARARSELTDEVMHAIAELSGQGRRSPNNSAASLR